MSMILEIYKKIRRRFLRYTWRLQCLINPSKIATFKFADGSVFEYPLNTAIGRELFTGDFEVVELEFARRSLKLGDVFLDIGANAGIYTILAAKIVGNSGHVYAFEPGNRELKLLQNNIKINKLTNVTIIDKAVSNKNGIAQFAVAVDGALNSLAMTSQPNQLLDHWQTVETISLDEFVVKFNLSKIDFIKIDAEGAEKLIFEGAKNVLSSEYPITIMFEASGWNVGAFDYTVEELISSLLNCGFYLYYFNEKNILTPISNYIPIFGSRFYNFILSNKPIL